MGCLIWDDRESCLSLLLESEEMVEMVFVRVRGGGEVELGRGVAESDGTIAHITRKQLDVIRKRGLQEVNILNSLHAIAP